MNILRRLQLVAHGEPSDVVELSTVSQPALGQDEVLISMEAAPLNPSDFLFIREIYGVRPAFPSPVGAEGIGRITKTGSKVDVDDCRIHRCKRPGKFRTKKKLRERKSKS